MREVQKSRTSTAREGRRTVPTVPDPKSLLRQAPFSSAPVPRAYRNLVDARYNSPCITTTQAALALLHQHREQAKTVCHSIDDIANFHQACSMLYYWIASGRQPEEKLQKEYDVSGARPVDFSFGTAKVQHNSDFDGSCEVRAPILVINTFPVSPSHIWRNYSGATNAHTANVEEATFQGDIAKNVVFVDSCPLARSSRVESNYKDERQTTCFWKGTTRFFSSGFPVWIVRGKANRYWLSALLREQKAKCYSTDALYDAEDHAQFVSGLFAVDFPTQGQCREIIFTKHPSVIGPGASEQIVEAHHRAACIAANICGASLDSAASLTALHTAVQQNWPKDMSALCIRVHASIMNSQMANIARNLSTLELAAAEPMITPAANTSTNTSTPAESMITPAANANRTNASRATAKEEEEHTTVRPSRGKTSVY